MAHKLKFTRRPRLGRRVVAFSVVAALSGALAAPLSPAYAADTPPGEPTARAEWLSSRAETAFAEGRFSDAIKLYLDAWEAVPSAAILYNVAFIYDRRLEDHDLAVQYYDRAAGSPDADQALIEKARARVAAIRAEKAERPKPRLPAPQPEPPRQGEGSNDLLGPALLMAGGGALLVGGLVVGLVASGTESEFHASRSADKQRSLQSAGKTQALAADLLMATGVATAAGGLVWLLLSGSSKESAAASDFRIEPMFVPGGGGLAIGGGL